MNRIRNVLLFASVALFALSMCIPIVEAPTPVGQGTAITPDETTHPLYDEDGNKITTDSVYSNVSSDDGNRWYVEDGTWETLYSITYDLSDYNSAGKVVTNVTLKFDGYRTTTNDATVHHYDFSRSAWEQDATLTADSDGAGWELETNMGDDLCEAINSTNHIQWKFRREGADTDLYTDALHLVITYYSGYILRSETIDGMLWKSNSTYQDAESSTATVYTNDAEIYVGQDNSSGTYYIYRSYLSFNTSIVPKGIENITGRLYLWSFNDYSTTAEFNVTVYSGNQPLWDTLDSQDWDVGTNLEGHLMNSSSYSDSEYYSLDISGTYINTTGKTQYELNSTGEGVAPTGEESIGFGGGDAAFNRRPCLIVYYDSIQPDIGEFQAPNTIYAYEQIILNATVDDVDGKTTLKNASLTLSADSIVLNWINSTNTFTIINPNNKWELVTGSRSSVNNTAYKLSWTVKAYWNSTEGYVNISSASVYDNQDATGSNSESNWFYNENDLEIDNANVDDSRVDPSQALTFTGQIYYNNTATAPYTTSGVTAKIGLSGVLKGSNSSIASDGSFKIGFNAESGYAQHSYTVYCVTDENSVLNQTVYVTVDRLNVTISANTTSPYVSDTVDFTVTAVYEYDGATVTGWTVNLYRNNSHYTSGNFTDMQSNELSYNYTVENVTDTTYDLSDYNSNTVTVSWLGRWDVRLQSRDYEGNVLSDATVYLNNGTEYSQAVNSLGWANWTDITSDTVDVYAKWQSYTVNSTFTLTLDSDQTVNVTCLCYPFTLSGTRYWMAGNATVDTYNWNSTTKKFTLSFTGSVANYTLKSSTSSKPTYILNATFDIDTDWTTLLTLSHYGNATLTLAYPNWATTRIYRTDHRVTNTYWADEKLYITITGTSGENGTLEVYCGGRGQPEETNGVSDDVYYSGTNILAGTYSLSTTTVYVDWTTTGGGGGGGGGTTPSIFATAENIDAESIQQGTTKTLNITATWTGSSSITVSEISFTGPGSEWVDADMSYPYTVERLAIETRGTITVPVTITIPRQATLGDYQVLIEYTIMVGTSTYQTTAQLYWTVTSTPAAPGGVAQLVSVLLLVALVATIFMGLRRR